MRTPSPESAHRLGELALLTTAFVLPLAFYLHTYDSATIRFAVIQWGALTMAFAWLWQGLSRGRFQAPASSWPALAPALAYGAWLAGRFAVEPHRLAALPDFILQLTMLVSFLAAFLGFAGARSAARFTGLVVAAGWIVAVYGLCQAAGLDPFIWRGAFGPGIIGNRVFSTLGNPYLCASFLGVAVTMALTLDMDAELSAPARAAALGLVPVAAVAVVLTCSTTGVASFIASGLVYAAVVAASLRTRAAFKAAALSALAAVSVAAATWMTTPVDYAGNVAGRAEHARRDSWNYVSEYIRLTAGAELRMFAERPLTGFGPGSFAVEYPRFRPAEIIKLENTHTSMTLFPEPPILGVAVELGLIGALLWAWLFGAALWTGSSGAAALRRAGALPESVYAAGFAAAAAGALIASHIGWGAHSAAPGWFAWPLAGLAAGLAPLAARRAAVSVYPLPVSQDIRRALYAPSLLAFAGLALLPGAWLRSDVELNSGLYFAKTGQGAEIEKSIAYFDKVLPGAEGWLMARYYRANALLDIGKTDQALAAYDELQAQAPDYVLVHALRGAAYAKLGDWKAAASERARQAELDPLYIENLIAWAEAARASGDLEQARVAASRAEALDANDSRVKLALAANALMERRLLAGARKTNGHGVAKKPR